MIFAIVTDNTLGIYLHVIIWLELLSAIQALGHDSEASAGKSLEVN